MPLCVEAGPEERVGGGSRMGKTDRDYDNNSTKLFEAYVPGALLANL